MSICRAVCQEKAIDSFSPAEENQSLSSPRSRSKSKSRSISGAVLFSASWGVFSSATDSIVSFPFAFFTNTFIKRRLPFLCQSFCSSSNQRIKRGRRHRGVRGLEGRLQRDGSITPYSRGRQRKRIIRRGRLVRIEGGIGNFVARHTTTSNHMETPRTQNMVTEPLYSILELDPYCLQITKHERQDKNRLLASYLVF